MIVVLPLPARQGNIHSPSLLPISAFLPTAGEHPLKDAEGEQTGKKWPFTGIFSGNWQHCCTALTVLAGLFLFDAMKHDRSLEVLVLGDFFCCSFETMQSKGFI